MKEITPYLWNQENLERYRQSLKHQEKPPMSRKIFYVEPRGTLAQQDMLLALAVNYQFGNVREDDLVKILLSFETPLTRMDFMSETEPGSGAFQPVTCDLLEKIIRRQDVGLLRRIYQAIEPERRPLADALLEK